MGEPNFFVVGAPRAGTTSLWHYLRQHPDVLMPSTSDTKEPSHFADPLPTWAEPFRDRSAYLKLFATPGTEKAIGEASPTYLGSEGCAQRIHDAYPDARIIISLRQPARRAFSFYQYMCQWGLEWLPSFERALEEEDDRLADAEFQSDQAFWFGAFLYFRGSLYSNQVKQWVEVFPREQIHILTFEDLKRSPLETTQKIYRFLDVDPDFIPAFWRANRSRAPAWPRLQHALARRWRNHPLFTTKAERARGRVVDRAVIPALLAGNVLAGRWKKAVLHLKTERRLLERYRSDIAQTAELTGCNLDHWFEPSPEPRPKSLAANRIAGSILLQAIALRQTVPIEELGDWIIG